MNEENNQTTAVPVLDQDFWNQRWETGETGWDIGQASPAITEYMKQYPNKDAAILIPGCGNAYEAEFLVQEGFSNITLIDIAPSAVKKLQEKFAKNPEVKVVCEDFFLHQGKYDLLIEQTFFCAISPLRREEYVAKSASLLNENGRIIGLLFNKHFNQPQPPFGGELAEYQNIFQTNYSIIKMEECYNSIPSRMNSEIFINLQKQPSC